MINNKINNNNNFIEKSLYITICKIITYGWLVDKLAVILWHLNKALSRVAWRISQCMGDISYLIHEEILSIYFSSPLSIFYSVQHFILFVWYGCIEAIDYKTCENLFFCQRLKNVRFNHENIIDVFSPIPCTTINNNFPLVHCTSFILWKNLRAGHINIISDAWHCILNI